MPNDEEIKKMKEFISVQPEGVILDKPERFVLHIADVKFFKEKSKFLNHQAQFHEKHTALQNNIRILSTALKSLHNHKELNTVLGLILLVGNKLNTSHASRGNAHGFELDILGNLKNVKNNDGSINLLQYIVQSYAGSVINSKVLHLL
jgi:hypothetical protein